MCSILATFFWRIWKILVKMGIFPHVGVKIKNIWNHHPVLDETSWGNSQFANLQDGPLHDRYRWSDMKTPINGDIGPPPTARHLLVPFFPKKKRVFPPVVSGAPNRGVVRPACLGGHLRSKVSLSISGASPNVGVVPPWRWNPTGKRSLAYAPAETAIKQTVTIPRTQRSTSNFWRSTPQNKAVPTKTRVIWILGIGSNVVG